MVKIKICGLRSYDDIRIVNCYKPDYAGFIINFPQSFRSVEIGQVASLTRRLDPSIRSVGVFVNEDIDTVVKLLEECSISMVQFHGQESDATVRYIQSKGFEVIQAFTVHTQEDVEKALLSSADYILLDQGKGSGKSFDWALIPAIERPFFLAGGLNITNIEKAVHSVHPYALDISSGVETDRKKDEYKIKEILTKGRRI